MQFLREIEKIHLEKLVSTKWMDSLKIITFEQARVADTEGQMKYMLDLIFS